ncbi:MAG: tyrosinase family protein [Saprospiraceae bacterium]|nr:tyrosinase family protein [Saprospiraceae bacterium]
MEPYPTFPTWSRRKFIGVTASGIAGIVLASLTGGCEGCLEKIKNRPIRRFLRTGEPLVDADINIYKAAVSAMKALPASNPCSWEYQRLIHANYCGSAHGSWHFFSWHRAYLFNFEQICRAQAGAGAENWGLPYWNWSNYPNFPTQFMGNAANPLYDNSRNTMAVPAFDGIVGPTNLNNILNLPDFTTFAGSNFSSGQLESGPHNYIHGYVCGNMCSVPTAALDPIFYMHHCMVDYCWYEWNILRNHANTNDPAWQNHNYTGMFADKNCNPVDTSVLATILMPLLSYQYEISPVSSSISTEPFAGMNKSDFKKFQDIVQKGASVSLDFKQRVEVAQRIQLNDQKAFSQPIRLEAAMLDQVMNVASDDRVLLTLEEMDAPTTSEYFVRVFLNLPNANTETPMDDPHYAGSFAFFAAGEAVHEGHDPQDKKKLTYIVDLTETVRRLKQGGEQLNPADLQLQFVPVPIDPQKGNQPFSLGISRARLGISPIKIFRNTETVIEK